MMVCIIIVKNIELVLQKRKQAKTKVKLNGKRIDKRNGKMSFSGIPTLNVWIAFVTYLANTVFKAHDFMPDLKVDQFMPVVIDRTTLLFYQQKNKITC